MLESFIKPVALFYVARGNFVLHKISANGFKLPIFFQAIAVHIDFNPLGFKK